MTSSGSRRPLHRRAAVVRRVGESFAVAALMASVVAATAAPAGAQGATLYASPNGSGAQSCADPSDACTLPSALLQATSGSTIDLLAGTYVGGFDDPTSVTIQPAPDVSNPVLSGGNQDPVLNVVDYATSTLIGVTVTNGDGIYGGGIFTNGTLTVEDSTISGNTSSSGGGIFDEYGTVILEDSTVSDNTATEDCSEFTCDGGGIYDEGTLTVEDSTIAGNSTSGGGGGIYETGDGTVEDSTISGNSAVSVGGGIAAFSEYSPFTIDESTISGNSATSTAGGNFAGWGGGIMAAGPAIIEGSTISGNSAAGGGGGIAVYYYGATIAASILATPGGPPEGGECDVFAGGAITDGGYNVDDDGTCGSILDAPAIDSYLGSLANNEGPTETVALTAGVGNPAQAVIPDTFDLPTGPAACSQPDQRGVARAPVCDMGSYALTAIAADGSGAMSASPPSVVVGTSGNTITFTYTAPVTGGLNSGAIDVVMPSGWSAPSTSGTDPGYSTATCGTVAASGSAIEVTGVTLSQGDSCTITYGAETAGGPGATAQSSLGGASFATTEESTSEGTLTPLESSPTVVTQSPPAPTVSGFGASPPAFDSAAGSVSLSANVTNASWCRFAVTPSVVGLPATVACSNGPVRRDVTLPDNTGTSILTYDFTLAVHGSRTVKTKVKVQVAPPANCAATVGPAVNLAGCDLADANLTGANLKGANLTGTNLAGAELAGADLRGANLSVANLAGADLANVNLKRAKLIDADLNGAGFGNNDLSGADLSGADLSNAYSNGTLSGTPSVLPANWGLISGYLIGPAANLTGATFSAADLAGADLAGADLLLAHLVNGTLLTGANLDGANLSNVYSDGTLLGTPSILPLNWSLTAGYLIGPGANLTGANLAFVNLAVANLPGINLSYANLQGANLSYAILSNANLVDADLGLADLSFADLVGANLGNDNLESADLEGASLVDANLADANLTLANMAGADVAGADPGGVIWAGTTCPDGSNSADPPDYGTCLQDF